MALTVGPFGTYADVTGIVNATAAPEVAALFVELKTLIPGPASAYDAGSGTPVAAISEQPLPHPEFDKMAFDLAERLRVEIDALAAAIAAAPTA